MEIVITKTIEVKEKLDLNKIQVVKSNSKGVDSINLDIYYNLQVIGWGHLNNKTNFAHIYINDNLLSEKNQCELVDYLINGIENRTIELI